MDPEDVLVQLTEKMGGPIESDVGVKLVNEYFKQGWIKDNLLIEGT